MKIVLNLNDINNLIIIICCCIITMILEGLLMKTLIIPKSIEEINDFKDYYDGIIIGIKDLSVNVNLYLTVEEVNNLKIDKEIFVALNKNMHNCDLELLENTMKSLKNIKGILYYDASVVALYSELKPLYDLVWSQEHMTTSSVTCNYWYEKGAKYVYLAGDITLDEIINIRKSTEMSLIVPIFGYLPMFVSKRHLVNNYLECFNIKDDSSVRYLEKEGKKYPILDTNLTSVYSANILNGIDAYKKLLENKIDYVTFNSFNIESSKFFEVLKIYKGESKEKVENLFPNLDTGFLYKETYYRVKKDD